MLQKHSWCNSIYKIGWSAFDEKGYDTGYNIGETTDSWGSVWHNAYEGYAGNLKRHPLEDLSHLIEYIQADPFNQTEFGPRQSWDEYAHDLRMAHDSGKFFFCYADHFLERIHFLMGMESIFIAIAEENPVLDKVIGMVLQQNMMLVNSLLEYGIPDMVGFQDDLGTQRALMVNPKKWRRYFKPGYRALFGACRTAGTLVRFHSDGNISEIIDDLVEVGVDILNCQVFLIGIDKVARIMKGKLCISADVDRQQLGSPNGGLEISAEINGAIPFENIAALLEAIAEYRSYWNC